MYRKRNREQVSVDDFIPPLGGNYRRANCWVGHVKYFVHIYRSPNAKQYPPYDKSRFPEPDNNMSRQATTAACGGLTLR